jgi:hypothetical protein
MDAKQVIAVILVFVAGIVGGLAYHYVLPEPGYRVTAVTTTALWIQPIWIGSWWLLFGVLAVVAVLLLTACWLLDQARDAAMRYGETVHKDDPAAAEVKRLPRSLDLRTWDPTWRRSSQCQSPDRDEDA